MANNHQPKIKLVPISDLVLDDRNANLGTARGRSMLEASLKRLGAGRSVLVDREGRVIAGNKTVEQALKLGMDHIAIVESDGKTLVAVQRNDLDLKKDKKAVELAIADNRVAEVDLDWNTDVLKALDLDLKQFWDEKELGALFPEDETLGAPPAQIDKAAELQVKWGTASGQLWSIGKHRLLCGDSTSEAERSIAMLRYAQSPEARTLVPLDATLGEIDCLVDLIHYHRIRLEDLVCFGGNTDG